MRANFALSAVLAATALACSSASQPVSEVDEVATSALRPSAVFTGWAEVPGNGTTITSDAAVTYNGSLYLFGIGIADHGHYMNRYDGASWSGWSPVPGGGTTVVSDAAVAFGGKLYLFGIGIGDHQHYVNVLDGAAWSGWSAVPGGGTTLVSDAAVAFGGKLYLFGIGIGDHQHYVNVLDGATWSGWSAVPGGGTTLVSDAAVAFGNKLYLFGIGIQDHAHYMNAFDGSTWSGWAAVPGNGTTVLPDAATVFDGQLYLFGIGINDHAHYRNVFDGTSWSGWGPVEGGGTTAVADSAATLGDKMFLFGVGIDDHRHYVNIAGKGASPPPGACVCGRHAVGTAPPLRFRKAQGTGAPSKPTSQGNPIKGTIPVHIADIDGDGLLDMSTNEQISNGQFQPLRGVTLDAHDNWHGVALVDLDNDGQKDLIMAPYDDADENATTPTQSARSQQPILFFHNEGGTFVPRDLNALVDGVPITERVLGWNSETIALADVDGNGFTDVFIPFYHNHVNRRFLLLMNHGGLRFTEEAIARGVAGTNTDPDPEGAQFADVDGDGDVDLVVATRVYVNRGDGHFVSRDLGIADAFVPHAGEPGHCGSVSDCGGRNKDEGLSFVDYTMDGYSDLFLHVPPTDKLLWAFDPITHRFGADSTRSQVAAKLKGQNFAWGDAWGDLDLDGDPDLVFQGTDKSKATLLLNDGKGVFDISTPWVNSGSGPTPGPLPHGDGIAVGDVDADGDLDLYYSTSDGALYLNDTERLPGAHALVVSPRDNGDRDNQYGASVVVRDTCAAPAHGASRMNAGANGVYLALNQYDVQRGVAEGSCYSVDVQFMQGPDGRPQVVSIPYDPKTEGDRRLIVRRDGTIKRVPLGSPR